MFIRSCVCFGGDSGVCFRAWTDRLISPYGPYFVAKLLPDRIRNNVIVCPII